MLLTSDDGAYVGLRVLRYKLQRAKVPSSADWDANWLVVAGEVRGQDGVSWSFTDPCLTTWEARQIAQWIRDAVDGRVFLACAGRLAFTEPNLGFSLLERDGDALTVRVHLSAECAPEATSDPERTRSVDLELAAGTLLTAAEAWDDELVPFPER